MSYVFREYRSRGKPWCIAYKGVDGRMRRERTDAPTKELAKKLLAKRLVDVTEAKIAGITIEQKPIRFGEFLKEYRKYIGANKSEGSIKGQETALKSIEPLFSHLQLKQVTTGAVQRFVDQRLQDKKRNGKPLRPSSINRELMCLSAIFREAVKRGYLERNPCRGIKQLPEQNIVVRYLSDDEEKQLLAACSERMKPIVLCGLHTGMRRGEILGLKWEDVDLDQGLLRVRLTKNKKTRYIPINPVVRELLKSLPRWDDGPHVFANPDTHQRWHDVKVAWQYTVRRSKVKNFRFHDLRHTFASRLVQKGVPLQVVQELLGHGSIIMTQRYAHLAPGDLRRAVDLLARAITTQPATQTGASEAPEGAALASPCEREENGAPRGTRTHDPVIKNHLLYQLS